VPSCVSIPSSPAGGGPGIVTPGSSSGPATSTSTSHKG
jgi:hypothetical protein